MTISYNRKKYFEGNKKDRSEYCGLSLFFSLWTLAFFCVCFYRITYGEY